MIEIILIVAGIVSAIIFNYFVNEKRITRKQKEIEKLEYTLNFERTQKNNEITRIKENMEQSYKTYMESWKYQEGQKLIEDTLKRSHGITKGKVWEQLAPLMPSFKYHTSDSRFIGSPIDFIIFNNYTRIKNGEDAQIEVVFMDVKTGKSELTPVQRKIKEAIGAGHVRWETLKL